MNNQNDIIKKLLETTKLNSIEIDYNYEGKDYFPKGCSKIGGYPDLPNDFKWYYYEGESFLDDEIKLRPLSFIAQFNCAELKEYDIEKRLPDRGMLYFFYEIESMKWGIVPEDKGCAKVFYYDGDINELVPTTPPNDLNSDYIFTEYKVKFESKYNAPHFVEFLSDEDRISVEEYEEIVEELELDSFENSIKLLGYSNNIQGDMTLECELVTNKLENNYSTNSFNVEELEKLKSKWKLLFQLDTDNFELSLSDCGRMYYYIKEEDLKNKNFENIWFILQSY